MTRSDHTELSGYAQELIRGRRATRAFRPDPVPEQTMRAIFSLAGAAPSNSNAQPWRVEVVSGAPRERLAASLRAAHAARRTSVDFPYGDDIYSPVQQERRAAFGSRLYGTLGIGPTTMRRARPTTPRAWTSTVHRTSRSCSSPNRTTHAWPATSAPTCRRCCWR
ncbi:nitroreductase family protein [Embleya scabrispora]|uniref:nitroreductase family protein n=1 Tax=Embleya scabrispora TaxID=159449 RepID=UPI0003AAAA01|nr:nitroreductase family protein [Embleya scabrispora]